MKNNLLFFALLLAKPLFGQLNDDFSDGDFTANPTWQGSGFQINGASQVQSLVSASGQTVALVSSNYKALNAVWEFYIQMDFDPSTSSKMRIYLVSNSQDLTGLVNGYYLQIGENGQTDSYDLYRQDGSISTKIIEAPPKTRISNGQLLARVRVTRDLNGNWEVLTDISGGSNFVSEGISPNPDLNYLTSSWFGIRCEYPSSTNSNKFYFDDVHIGNLVDDTEAPQLVEVTAIDSLNLEATFNEAIEPQSGLNTLNYTLNNGYGNPIEIKAGSSTNKYLLTFGSSLNTNNYKLSTSNLSDFNFNTQSSASELIFSYTKPYLPNLNDLVINELFADPSPQIDLPSVEFVELWNSSEFEISVDKWTYSDGTNTATLPAIKLAPKEYVMLCALADVANFSAFGKVIGLSVWPSLNNIGDNLVLKNASGQLMNSVKYADTWYHDASKKEGGWTLELVDPKSPCSGIQNWAASTHASGGTPGKVNSIYQSNLAAPALSITQVELLDSVTLLLHYNRYVDSTSAAFAGHYSLNNGMGPAIEAKTLAPYFQTVQLTFANPLSLGLHYTLHTEYVSDCSGTLIEALNTETAFYLPKKIYKNDLLISEILFNPSVGGADFVEIYNASDHPLDLKDLNIASTDAKDSLINPKAISKISLLIPAKSYRVLSTNPEYVLATYNGTIAANLIEVDALPSFNDDAGVVVLLRDSLRIDQLNYRSNMHFSLLATSEGISLERSLFSEDANEPGNFRSAAAAAGFATPGYQNSQFLEQLPQGNELVLSSVTLSPDSDGYEDALTLVYHWQAPGLVANVNIYTDRGQLVRRLIKNQSLGSQGLWVWDGLNEYQQVLPMGIYVIKVEVFGQNGQVKQFTKTCAIATKLN